MKGKKLITAGFLALGLSFAGLAFASAYEKLPPEVVEALQSGTATVVFYDAEGNPVWTSTLGLEPREDLLALAVRAEVLDPEGNVLFTFEVSVNPGGDPVLATQDGLTFKAEKLAEAALKTRDHDEDDEQEMEEHRYQEEEREQYREQHEEQHEGAKHEDDEDGEYREQKGSHDDDASMTAPDHDDEEYGAPEKGKDRKDEDHDEDD